ncbi:MAG: hypothetical protein D6711_14215 [Chloroflexi bacterium]|nr:MAG: hypothetical protein D6711_14215 [Chloroflexota bacterium]
MAAFNTITPPTGVPVTVQELKDRLRITSNAENGRLYGLLEAAAQWAEDFTGAYIMPRGIELTMDRFPAREFTLGVWPIVSVDSVIYDSADSPSVSTTVAASEYELDLVTVKGRIRAVNGWPSTSTKVNAVRIRMTVGYSSKLTVPEGVKEGIKLYAAGLYYCDDAMREAAKNTLWNYRVVV